jgi:hypothetical protein
MAMPSFFISCRSVNSDGTFSSGIADPRYLVIPDGEAEPNIKYENPSGGPVATRATRWARMLLDSVPQAPGAAPVAGKPIRNLLFIVHGFNQTAAAALQDHHNVANGLQAVGWTGQVVSFDWPSDGSVIAYIDDTELARGTASKLVKGGIGLFVTITAARQVASDCDVAVHVLAHSMGAFVTREAFDYAGYDKPARGIAWQINQLALISGDISADSMSTANPMSTGVYEHSGRVTNYSNAHDDVLQISNAKRAFTSPRVGRIGLPSDTPQLACNVEAGDVWLKYATDNPTQPGDCHGFWFHSSTFFTDLRATLEGKVDRNAMPTRTMIAPNRLVLNP